MKIIFENMKTNYFIKIAFVIFIIECLISFYNSIELDSIDLLFKGIVQNFYWFLILYALGLIIEKKGSNKNDKNS